MDLDAFCNTIKKHHPDISNKADKLYDKYWNDLIEMEFSSHSWFESLANALNSEMKKGVPPQNYVSLLNEISQGFINAQSDVKEAIDVAFVENLYWQVREVDAKPYWDIMPNILKQLYIEFHERTPL